ncbi:MAG: PQQ-like beta-propeller repeat protein [Verrucomicrobiales bacterium]|nr:PQQ-like beta-propeller repeat protein [Verrucomicrobiales bacterium]
MKTSCSNQIRMASLAGGCLLVLCGAVQAQDWPEWRGPNRQAKAVDFKAPAAWPKELTRKWQVTVGEGVATPALVGDRLYVFARQDGKEVTRCLEAGTGKELWQESYDALGATGPSQGFSGPRSSPLVTQGKVVTVGVRGVISCLDAATGKVLWRKDDFKAWPSFFVASSPLVVEGLVVAQLGGADNGALVAYELGSGAERWRWSGSSPGYASPVILAVGGEKLVFAQTETAQVAVKAADGKVVWESAGAGAGEGGGGGPGGRGGRGGGGRDYKATTPAVDGAMFVLTGRGNKAVRFERSGDGFSARELWSHSEKPAQFASPVLKDGLVIGFSAANEFFCLDAQDGALLWSVQMPSPAEGQAAPAAERPAGQEGARGPGGPGGRGGRMGGGGYGSLVDVGPAVLALTPSSDLIVFKPSRERFEGLARYKVAESPTHAYPVVSGNRVFVKDREAVILWTLE